jgi:SAM-dependent methyltransferase
MIATDRKTHWEHVYSAKAEADVSWHQDEPRLSLELIGAVAPAGGCRVIDVGGGASVLVDKLLGLPFGDIAVLDISETALGRARARLGERAEKVRWVVADVTEGPELGTFDVWHDRAVFHFLTDPADRRRYIELSRQTVPEGGHLVIATFADDGPRQCSNLDVCRYNARSLASELGGGFSLVREAKETHATPWGSSQPFVYGVFKRL